ncbi:hypothetical protein ES705_49220 [subsurface metagenome]
MKINKNLVSSLHKLVKKGKDRKERKWENIKENRERSQNKIKDVSKGEK